MVLVVRRGGDDDLFSGRVVIVARGVDGKHVLGERYRNLIIRKGVP